MSGYETEETGAPQPLTPSGSPASKKRTWAAITLVAIVVLAAGSFVALKVLGSTGSATAALPEGTPPEGPAWVAVAGRIIDGADGGGISVSNNGTDWVDTGVDNWYLEKVIANPAGGWVAGGITKGNEGGIVVVSADGTKWEEVDTGGAGENVAYGDGMWLAASEEFLATSTDAKTWTSQVSPAREVTALAYGNGVWVMAGKAANPEMFWRDEAVWASTDGRKWTETLLTEEDNPIATGEFVSIAFGDGSFVAAASGGSVYASDNGTDWVKTFAATSDSESFYRVTFANGVWFIGGGESGYLTSSDGVDWTQFASTEGHSLKSVAYRDGMWVAAGLTSDRTPTFATSSDGQTWGEVTPLPLPDGQLFNAAGVAARE